MSYYEGDFWMLEKVCFVIFVSCWNVCIIDVLVVGVCKSLVGNGIEEVVIDVICVLGVWELLLVVVCLVVVYEYVVIIVLGCVICGDICYYEYVVDGCVEGLMCVQLDFGVLVFNGVLVVECVEDVDICVGGSYGNKGEEVVLMVLEMVNFLEQLL